jgi:hypothetical protein
LKQRIQINTKEIAKPIKEVMKEVLHMMTSVSHYMEWGDAARYPMKVSV